MVGTQIFSVSFIMSLIRAQRWEGLLAVTLFHVWTLSSDAALSVYLFTLLSNSYLCDEMTLNPADKDEKHGAAVFPLLFSGPVSGRKVKMVKELINAAWPES